MTRFHGREVAKCFPCRRLPSRLRALLFFPLTNAAPTPRPGGFPVVRPPAGTSAPSITRRWLRTSSTSFARASPMSPQQNRKAENHRQTGCEQRAKQRCRRAGTNDAK